MPRSNTTIYYHDFHPSAATKEFIDSVITEIAAESPRGATVKATFTSKDELIKGMLQVNSYGGPIFSVAVAEDLREVTIKLVEQLRRRLEKFKAKQHSRNGLKQTLKKQAYEFFSDQDSGVA